MQCQWYIVVVVRLHALCFMPGVMCHVVDHQHEASEARSDRHVSLGEKGELGVDARRLEF